MQKVDHKKGIKKRAGYLKRRGQAAYSAQIKKAACPLFCSFLFFFCGKKLLDISPVGKVDGQITRSLNLVAGQVMTDKIESGYAPDDVQSSD
jgi:hypothetical protein